MKKLASVMTHPRAHHGRLFDQTLWKQYRKRGQAIVAKGPTAESEYLTGALSSSALISPIFTVLSNNM